MRQIFQTLPTSDPLFPRLHLPTIRFSFFLVSKKDFDDDDVVGMVLELREKMQKLADRIPRKKEVIPPGLSDDPSCTTSGGNCWSCGIPFRPKLKFRAISDQERMIKRSRSFHNYRPTTAHI